VCRRNRTVAGYLNWDSAQLPLLGEIDHVAAYERSRSFRFLAPPNFASSAPVNGRPLGPLSGSARQTLQGRQEKSNLRLYDELTKKRRLAAPSRQPSLGER
jgi:hypothetical protein